MSDETPAEEPTRRFRYGQNPTWQIALDAVLSFARPASLLEVREHIVNNVPSFATSNLFPDLSMLSVNCASRGNYKPYNKNPRRSDSGSPYDRLFKIGNGQDALYTEYDPKLHGTWELLNVGDEVLRPRFLGTHDHEELEHARAAADADGVFDPDVDSRTRTIAAIVQREGQPDFRKNLLQAYNHKCAISDCAVEALLEAAHIAPYRGVHTNAVGNGLLLRVDLHKLLDLHLISIDPDTRIVRVSNDLRQSEYASFDGVRLRDPVEPGQAPLADALKHHYTRCGWLKAGPGGAPLDDADKK